MRSLADRGNDRVRQLWALAAVREADGGTSDARRLRARGDALERFLYLVERVTGFEVLPRLHPNSAVACELRRRNAPLYEMLDRLIEDDEEMRDGGDEQ
jgi:hypothetical protein